MCWMLKHSWIFQLHSWSSSADGVQHINITSTPFSNTLMNSTHTSSTCSELTTTNNRWAVRTLILHTAHHQWGGGWRGRCTLGQQVQGVGAEDPAPIQDRDDHCFINRGKLKHPQCDFLTWPDCQHLAEVFELQVVSTYWKSFNNWRSLQAPPEDCWVVLGIDPTDWIGASQVVTTSPCTSSADDGVETSRRGGGVKHILPNFSGTLELSLSVGLSLVLYFPLEQTI